jgi:putative CocE/NonD family hydrolase
MYGCSNTGDAAVQALTVRPPALKAVFAGCFSWHKYDAFRRGGIFAQWGTGPTRTVAQDVAIPPVDGDEGKVLLRQAAEEHQKNPSLLELWKGMPFRDSHSALVGSRFWAEGSTAMYREQIKLANIPLYIQGGWRDELRDQGLNAHLSIPGSRVIVGPWKHCDSEGFALIEEMHRFFDRHLKDIDTGLNGDAPIHYFTVNAPAGSEWKSASAWPLPSQQSQPWFLTGGLLTGNAGKSGPRSFAARADIACPEAGSGARIQPCHVAGSGVSSTGPVLRQAVEVTGNPLVSLWIASNRADANVFAYLEDVSPDGTVEVVTEGRLKASLRKTAISPWPLPAGVPWHRAYAEDAQPLTPGQPVQLEFAMMPTSWLFRPGHRIQITVTGADHRERLRDPAPTTITLYGDKAHPARVTLPVIPAR